MILRLRKALHPGAGTRHVLLGVALWGCATTTGHKTPGIPIWRMEEVQVIDLTYAFGPDTIYWPTGESFSLEPVFQGYTAEGYWYTANNLRMAEHGGTHMDAPLHFGKGKAAADQVALESLIGPAAVIDVREQTSKNRDYQLQIGDILRWEQRYGRIPDGAFVIMHSGWGRHWGEPKTYLGSDRPGAVEDLHFPGFSPQAVRFLIEERNVGAIGIDTASIDHGPSKDFQVHQIVAEANKPAFENLANVSALPHVGALIIALPLKVAGGSGGPARVIALVAKN